MRAREGGLFLYCQSAFGVGHFVRVFRLIHALHRAIPSLPITLFHGGRSAAFLRLPAAVERIELEPLLFAGPGAALSASDGSPPGPLLRRRKECLIGHLTRLRPRAVLFEHFPFGRWAFRDEILPLLEASLLLTPCPKLWCSVREIPILSEYDYDRMTGVVGCFDRIFVHSDPVILSLDLGRPIPESVESRIEYTGYVTPNDQSNPGRGTHVLLHAGGGYDGMPFWRAVNQFSPTMAFVRFVRCGENPNELTSSQLTMQLLRSARRSISMAGYNTVAEWLTFRIPTIFVPRQSDAEQVARIRKLQEYVGGPMAISDATPEGLRSAWEELRDNEPFRFPVRTRGQEHFARTVCQHFL
jgi:predicted glycosyltransferase